MLSVAYALIVVLPVLLLAWWCVAAVRARLRGAPAPPRDVPGARPAPARRRVRVRLRVPRPSVPPVLAGVPARAARLPDAVRTVADRTRERSEDRARRRAAAERRWAEQRRRAQEQLAERTEAQRARAAADAAARAATKRCSRCDLPIRAQARVCRHCGHRYGPPPGAASRLAA